MQQPSKTDPVHNPERAQARRDVVLDRMHALGMTTDKAWKAAKKVPVKKMVKPQPAQSTCAALDAAVLLRLRPRLPQASSPMALGKTIPERIKKINQGGLTIQTTLDPKIQAMAQAQLVKKVPIGNKQPASAARPASSSPAPARSWRWPRPPTSPRAVTRASASPR